MGLHSRLHLYNECWCFGIYRFDDLYVVCCFQCTPVKQCPCSHDLAIAQTCRTTGCYHGIVVGSVDVASSIINRQCIAKEVDYIWVAVRYVFKIVADFQWCCSCIACKNGRAYRIQHIVYAQWLDGYVLAAACFLIPKDLLLYIQLLCFLQCTHLR